MYNGPNDLLGSEGHLGTWLYIDSSTVDPHTSRKKSSLLSTRFNKQDLPLNN
jgi:hypothetical protein